MGWTKVKTVTKPFHIVPGTLVRITEYHKTEPLREAIPIGRTGELIDGFMTSRVCNTERKVFVSCQIQLTGDVSPTHFLAIRFEAAQPAQSTFYRNIHLIRAGLMCPECFKRWDTKGPCKHK